MFPKYKFYCGIIGRIFEKTQLKAEIWVPTRMLKIPFKILIF